MLDKSRALFDRDESGKVIPKTVDLVSTGRQDENGDWLEEPEKIRITPLSRSEWIKLQEKSDSETSRDEDREIIKSHCVEPEFSEEDLNFIKPAFASAIVTTILNHSGINIRKEGGGDELGK